MLRELSLFSGYGGFSLGLRLTGVPVRTVGYVEIERYCQEIIKARIRDGILTMPQSSPIYVPLTVGSAEDWWTSLQEDSLASPSQQPEQEKRLMTHGTSGPIPTESFVKFDHESRCWRTFQGSFTNPTGEPYSGTWPRAGLLLNGTVYRLRPSVPLTAATDFGFLLPTPQRMDGQKGGGPPNEKANIKRWGGVNSLGRMAALGKWPTMTSTRSRNRTSGRQPGSKHHDGVTIWDMAHVLGGALNPPWIEWFMGLPLTWTGLEPLATGSYQEWWESFSRSSSEQ